MAQLRVLRVLRVNGEWEQFWMKFATPPLFTRGGPPEEEDHSTIGGKAVNSWLWIRPLRRSAMMS